MHARCLVFKRLEDSSCEQARVDQNENTMILAFRQCSHSAISTPPARENARSETSQCSKIENGNEKFNSWLGVQCHHLLCMRNSIFTATIDVVVRVQVERKELEEAASTTRSAPMRWSRLVESRRSLQSMRRQRLALAAHRGNAPATPTALDANRVATATDGRTLPCGDALRRAEDKST